MQQQELQAAKVEATWDINDPIFTPRERAALEMASMYTENYHGFSDEDFAQGQVNLGGSAGKGSSRSTEGHVLDAVPPCRLGNQPAGQQDEDRARFQNWISQYPLPLEFNQPINLKYERYRIIFCDTFATRFSIFRLRMEK